MCETPTKEQETAIFHPSSEYVLRAAPGSGKTWTSCRRFIWRTANWPHPVGGLALLSFTNVAVREFKKAAQDVGEASAMDSPNYVGTSDAFVDRFILGPFGHLLTTGGIRPRLAHGKRPGDDQNQTLLHWEKSAAGQSFPTGAWDILPVLQGDTLTFRSKERKELPTQAGEKVRNFIRTGRYTHAHRGYFAVLLLEARPHLARALARRFPEIIIDEAQDCGGWIVKIIRILRQHGAKITLVGDADQCIFGFSQADSNLLAMLRNEWGLIELPLSKSFRCNNRIAEAARRLGTNTNFVGNGDPGSTHKDAFVVRETQPDFADALGFFLAKIGNAGLSHGEASILCRGHDQLEKIRGFPLFRKLKGLTADIAAAAYARDCEGDYDKACKAVDRFMRDASSDDAYWQEIDEEPEGPAAKKCRAEIWAFAKQPSKLPSLSLDASTWLQTVRTNLDGLQERLGLPTKIKFGQKVKKTGLDAHEETMPLMAQKTASHDVRHQTIHQVKGESIDAVLVTGAPNYWSEAVKAAVDGAPTEATRLAYVAATRARHLLVVALPAKHYDAYHGHWTAWGFQAATAQPNKPQQKVLA